MYSYLPNLDLHAEAFAKILDQEIELIRENKLQEHLTDQINIYGKKWSWDYRITEWIKYLDGLYQTTKLHQS
jgi:hypothetical protein